MTRQDVFPIYRIELTEKPITLDSVQDFIEENCHNGNYGAVTTFFGVVRENETCGDNDQHIMAIEYETYNALFIGEAERLIKEIQLQIEGLGPVLVIHRLEEIPVGGNTVVIVVAAEHLQPALKALDMITKGLKCRCPLWKKAIKADGVVRWLNPRP